MLAVVQIVDVAGALVVDAEDWPLCLGDPLSLMRLHLNYTPIKYSK